MSGSIGSLVKFVCVLKSGGEYGPEYVYALRNALRRHVYSWNDSRLVVLSDIQVPTVRTVPLQAGLPGWWSKVEMFRIMGPVIYLDLDTVIVGSLDPLVKCVRTLIGEFVMLKAFNKKEQWASGVMAWKGNWSWLYNQFDPRQIPGLKWDQRYIKKAIIAKGISILAVQDSLPGVYSYKHHCQDKLPKDASLICFHGKPRPIDVDHEWCKKAWAA